MLEKYQLNVSDMNFVVNVTFSKYTKLYRVSQKVLDRNNSKKSENATKKDEKDSWKCVYIQQRSADLLSIWPIFLLKKKKKFKILELVWTPSTKLYITAHMEICKNWQSIIIS